MAVLSCPCSSIKVQGGLTTATELFVSFDATTSSIKTEVKEQIVTAVVVLLQPLSYLLWLLARHIYINIAAFFKSY